MDKKFLIQLTVLFIVIIGGFLTVFNPASLGISSIIPGGGTPSGTGADVSSSPSGRQQLIFIDQNSTGDPELVRGIITVDVADDPTERSKGLSYRESMAENEGMLFIFDQPTIPRFIMREMRFPLDFVWISGDKVVDLIENAPPEAAGTPDDQLRSYSPGTSVDRVVEVNSGYIKKFGLKVGDRIRLQEVQVDSAI